MTPETCKNGHVRTEENTSFVKDTARNRVRKRCLDCRRKGTPDSRDLKVQAMGYRHEDIEDLIRFGATFEEIIQRSGYANWLQMSRSLREAGRQDLLDKMRHRRGAPITQMKPNARRRQRGVSDRVAHRIPTLEDLPFDVNSRY